MKCNKCEIFIHPAQFKTSALKCPTCLNWFHIDCTDIDTDYVQYYLTEATKTNGDKWTCTNCNINTSTVQNYSELELAIDKVLKIQISQLKSELFKTLSCEINKIKENITDITNKQKEMQSDIDKLKKQICTGHSISEEYFVEAEERIRRSNNIIIFNLDECDKTNIEEKKQEDLRKVNNIFNQINMSNKKPMAMFRIGKKSSSPRPLKVIFPKKHDAIDILKNSNRITDKNIQIKADLTKNQREHLKTLRDELNQRKLKGEMNITIRYVNGSPIISSTKSAKN